MAGGATRSKRRDEEVRRLFEELDRILAGVRGGGEPAWKTIREFRDNE